MTDYQVEPVKHRGEQRWIVRTPDGRVANGHYHPSEGSAQDHADKCNAFGLNRQGSTHHG